MGKHMKVSFFHTTKCELFYGNKMVCDFKL